MHDRFMDHISAVAADACDTTVGTMHDHGKSIPVIAYSQSERRLDSQQYQIQQDLLSMGREYGVARQLSVSILSRQLDECG